MIELSFEISEDSSDSRTPEELFSEILAQFAQSSSALRAGDFGFFADNATVSRQDEEHVDLTDFDWFQVPATAATAVAPPQAGSTFTVREPPENLSAPLEVSIAAEKIRALEAEAEVQRVAQSRLKRALEDAKEMWMKESARATRMTERLNKKEVEAEEQVREIGKLRAQVAGLQTENTNLRAIVERCTKDQGAQNLRSAAFLESTPFTSTTAMPATAMLGPAQAVSQPGGYFSSQRQLRVPATVAALATTRNLASMSDLGRAQQDPSSDRWIRGVVVGDGEGAVLYEDGQVQIGVKQRVVGIGEAMMSMFVGNKGTGALQNVRLEASSVPKELQMTVNGNIPMRISGKQQICINFGFVALAAFEGSPIMQLSYLLGDNTPKTLVLKLPITVTKFCQPPVSDDPEQLFLGNWREQEFHLNESSQLMSTAASQAQILKNALAGNALALLPGVDENPNNLSLAGIFPNEFDGLKSAKIPEALVLVRLEIGQGTHRGQVRITVRSSDGVLSEAVTKILVELLAI